MKSLSKIVAILALVVFSFCLISCPSPDNDAPTGNTPAGTSGSGTPTGANIPSGTPQSQTPTTYSITVTNGTANPTSATAGETVTITANAAPSGQAFNGWTTTTNGVTFENSSLTTTTFTMPASNVSITATYAQTYYSISVTNGTANPTTATVGETVTITANAAPQGQAFDSWTTTTNGVTFANSSSTTTTFTMPASNVSITATYAQIYSISVTNCTANPTSATAGTTITVTANQAPSDLVYSPGNWTVTPSTEYTESGGSITFTMPESNVTVSLSFVAPSYSINVTGGNANPTSAPAGTTVTLTSRYAPASGNYVNWSWNPTNLFFTNPYGYQTTFIMRSQDVTASAECKSGQTYNINLSFSSNGDELPNPVVAPAGKTVYLQAKPNAGYHTEWQSSDVTFITGTGNTTSFTMPTKDVSINVVYVVGE